MASIGLASAFRWWAAGCSVVVSYDPRRAVCPVATLVNVRTNRSRTARQARSAVWHASVVVPGGCAQVRPRRRCAADGAAIVGADDRRRPRRCAGAAGCCRAPRLIVAAAVTEIPEHLLKRSRDRRAALGLGGGQEGEAAGRGGRGGDPGDDRAGDARRPRRRAGRPGRPQGRRCAGPAAAAEARPAVRRGGEAAAEDPVLGDGRAEPDADLGVHVRALGHRAAGGRHRSARRRRRGLRQRASRATAPAARAASAGRSPTARS